MGNKHMLYFRRRQNRSPNYSFFRKGSVIQSANGKKEINQYLFCICQTYLDTRGVMICIDCLHINLNRMLLLAVGLWPYHQSKLVQFQLILFFTILITCIIFQFTTFATSKCTSSLLINVFSSALFYIYFLILYSWFHINIEVVKCLLEQLQNMYNELTDKNEITIIKKYGNYGKRYTAGLILSVVFLAPGPVLYLHWPYLVNSLLPINDFQPRSPLFITEYFVDQEKYSYLILFHTLTALFVGIITIIATGGLFIVYLQYACGMFRIANYRIEQVMAIDTLRKESILRNKNLIYKKLIRAVNMHREAMRFSKSSISKFKVMFSCLLAIAVASASLNFFRIFQALSFGNDVEELLFPLVTVGIYITFILMANFIAQEVMDHNNNVFDTAYNIQWYAVSLNVQKMILFILQRGSKAFNLNIAGLFVGSLEGAASNNQSILLVIISSFISYFMTDSRQRELLSTMISFFTVLYSTRV